MSIKREYSHIDSEKGNSIRQQIFALLEKNHGLSPSNMCRILALNYREHGATVRQYKSDWRREYKNRPALKCLNYHKARGWVYALKSFERGEHGSRERAILYQFGWRQTEARNRMLLYKDPIGRLEWFETGRINIWINKPSSWGRVKQLLANGFYKPGIIQDVEKFDMWAGAVRFKGAHATLDLGEPLPYSKVDFLKESLGVVVKTGDVSHPSCLEIEFTYPDWAEKNEMLFEQNMKAIKQFSEAMRDLAQPKRLDPQTDHKMIS